VFTGVAVTPVVDGEFRGSHGDVMVRLGHAVANGEGTAAVSTLFTAVSKGRSIAADRGGFQLDDDEDLLPREVIHKSDA
jgi:hypothetical protein